jgi:hypothetical protein
MTTTRKPAVRKPARKPRRTSTVTAAAREKRDTLILDLFLAGHTQRAIAANPQVKLTAARVNGIVKTELERATKDHILRNENAMIIWHARMETLVREAMSHVTAGELKAIEPARRLMAEQAKIYGLVDEDIRSPVPPMGDTELDDEPADELARYRSQRQGRVGKT